MHLELEAPVLAIEERLTSDEAKSLSERLSLLCKLQYEALQKASYNRMSQAERDAYDVRRIRIAGLCGRLSKPPLD